MPPSPPSAQEQRDLALDQAVACRVFGHAVTVGPDGRLAVTTGSGQSTRFTPLLPVSTNLDATWKAVTTTLANGHADLISASAERRPDGSLDCRVSFSARRGEETVALATAGGSTLARAICAALLGLYDQPADRLLLPVPSRSLQ